MPPSWPADVLRLIRVRNLLIAAAGVAVGGVVALGRFAIPEPVWLAMGSAIGLGAAGNVANDLSDLEADRINRPDRPLVAGRISRSAAILTGGLLGGTGLVLAWMAGAATLAIATGALVVMLVYSPLLKRNGIVGNVAVAVVASLPLVYGPAALGAMRAGTIPFVFASLLHLARELVKDLEDVAGDRMVGRRTMPIVHGEATAYLAAAVTLVAFVPASLAPWFAGKYGDRYGVVVVLLNLGVLALVARLLQFRHAGARAALKLAMVAGLAALVWDRL
ncbi:MAG TPA: UbiA family prenyltransferase [Gemmatimonadales bacterium]|nr:UbiA family prenyltransferase [Gemmatimonadales bacterium]